jgi:hypothetical protein
LKPERQPRLLRDGTFDPAGHDFGDKNYLGQTIKGSGFAEIEQAAGILRELGDWRAAYLGDRTITIWRFSIRGICSTLDVVSISDRIRSSTRTPMSW